MPHRVVPVARTPGTSPSRLGGPSLAADASIVRPSQSSVVGLAAPYVLVVDPDAAVREQFEQLGHDRLLVVVAVATPREALEFARHGRVDAVIIDGAMGAAALEFAHDLRAITGLERVPMAFLSERGEVEQRVEAAHAGAMLYLSKPVEAYGFGAAIDQMLALGREEHMRVLIVDDDVDFAACVIAVLEPHGIAVRTAPDATHLVELLEEVQPDLILLDAMLPQVSGWDAIRIMRTMPQWRDVPILFLTARTDLESRIAAFDAGADDYLAKPLVPEELLARVRVRLDRRRLARETTERDPLTRCMSRGALLDALASRLSEARRHSRTLSLAMIDVDRFKRVNDTYGHVVGDHVLMGLGRLLSARFRLEDLRGRWGGEEFVIAFPNEPAATAAAVLSRVLEEFGNLPFQGEHGERFFVSFSAGVSSFPDDGSSVDALIRVADRRLYTAKHSGRAHVVMGDAVAS
jgi:diguanylate cyclase (GGDEF)-like protein